VAGLTGIIIEAFTTGDPAKLQKVTDVLEPGHPERIRAMLRLQEEIARHKFQSGGGGTGGGK